jgi:hypothetical protein
MLSEAGSVKINFCLNKIIYKKITIPVFNKSYAGPLTPAIISEYKNGNLNAMNIVIKDLSPSISPDKYLNIWVVDGLGGDLLGYATFPWDLKPSTAKYDGVVINKDTFGKNPAMSEYNLNKTATHEIGHWLGLFHTFQPTITNSYTPSQKSKFMFDYDKDGKITTSERTGDCIIDTPTQNKPTYGNPFINHSLWESTMSNGRKSWHMFMNFMDYVDDASMFMFTDDQAKKLRLIVLSLRPNIIN